MHRSASVAVYGALALAATMVGAIATHLFIVGGSIAAPVVLLAVTGRHLVHRLDALEPAMSTLAMAAGPTSVRLDAASLDQLFLTARTHHRWLPQPVDGAVLRELYELARMAPTSTNSQPLRLVFLTSGEARERLRPTLAPANVETTMSAPVTAIVAHDLEFYDHLPALLPHVDARARFASRPAGQIARIAEQGSALQGGYVILAARALGLDCGPIGGFDHARVDEEFFPDGRWKSNFLVNLGYGDPAGLHPRNPRLAFEDACRIL